MTRHSDFLQKISSTTTPPQGREVLSMDKIVTRELFGRSLDEADMKSLVTSKHLINRLFMSTDSPQFTPSELNARYESLVNSTRNTKNENTTPVQASSAGSSRILRSRTSKRARVAAAGDEGKMPAPQDSGEPSLNLRSRIVKRTQPAVNDVKATSPQIVAKGSLRSLRSRKSKCAQPAGDSKAVLAQSSRSLVAGLGTQVLYDTKARVWNVAAVDPGEPNTALDDAILQQFQHPKGPALYTGTGVLDNPVVDNPAPGSFQSQPGGNSGPSKTSPFQLVPRQGDGTDAESIDATEKIDEEPTSSLEEHARKGAAYDGDCSLDKDYAEATQKNGREGKEAPLASSEAQWAAFLNTLAIILSPGSRHGRQWHGSFATKPLPSEEGDAQWNRKPDLVLLEHQDGRSRDDGITWSSIKALGELTTSKLEKNMTLINSLNTKAYILLCSQPWRRYVLALSIASDELRIHLFDRSGVVTSPPVNIHTNITKTCHIIYAFAHADSLAVSLGFDPTLQISCPHLRQPAPPSIGTVQIDNTTYIIIAILWKSNGFTGRCTNIFHVRPEGAPPRARNRELDQFDYIVKDCWLPVEEHLVDHEERILKRISGIAGIPSLVEAWTVQYQGGDDTTLRHRPSNWDLALMPRYLTRFHRRLMMTPVGSPLSSFRSQRELLLGLIRGLEIHECLVREKGVLHRDISPNNMVFERSNNPGERSLILIDFDYAICLDGSTAQYPKGTGTLPFVSLAVLRQATAKEELSTVVHEVADDLESFFYVFTWICVLYNGPNGALVSPSEHDTSIVHGWGEAALRTGGLTYAMQAKSMFIHAPNRIIEEQFTPYFQNLKSLARRWQKLVQVEDKRREEVLKGDVSDGSLSDGSGEPSSPKSPSTPDRPLCHETIINLLRHYADNLPVAGPNMPSDSIPMS